MDLAGWDQRYRSRERSVEEVDAGPTPLLAATARRLRPGTALDLASGSGRNALWLAAQGWHVTAVDGAPAAIANLQDIARERGLQVNAQVADLKRSEYAIAPESFDLVAICYYLQRDLFAAAKEGVKPGGLLLAIAHTTQGEEQPTENRLMPGELESYFEGWDILHRYEGKPNDSAHARLVSEVVARRPA